MHVEVRSWSLLLLTLALFAFLCAAAALSTAMLPTKWSERRARRGWNK